MVNILLHSLNAGLVFLLMKKWLDRFRPALLGGLLFSALAIFSQPVNYLSNRATLLAVGFILAGLLLDWPGKNEQARLKYLRLALVLLCFWLGLFSKELAVVFPVLVLISDLLLNRRKWDRFRIFANVLYWLNLGLLFLLRYKLFGAPGGSFYPRGFQENALIQTKSVFYYLLKFFWPIHLSVLPEIDLAPGQMMIFLAALLGLSLLALVYRRRNKILVFGWFWFLIALLPSSLMPLNVLVNEERAYLPGPGMILGLVWLTEQVITFSPRGANLAFGLILFCNLVLVEFRIPAWRDEPGLWRDTIKKSPGISAGYVMYAHNFDQGRDDEKALKYYQQALDYDPNNPQALSGLCRIYLKSRKLELVKEFAMRSERVSVHPFQKAEAVSYQAIAELLTKNFEEAEKLARDSLALHPGQAKALYVLAAVNNRAGEREKAEEYAREALRIDPDFAMAHELLGLLLGREDKSEEAIIHLKKYVELNPEPEAGWLNLGMAYFKNQELVKARSAIEKALEKNKEYAQGYYGLAVVEWGSGNREKALAAMKQALILDPEMAPAHLALLAMLVKNLEDGYVEDAQEQKQVFKEAQDELKWLKARNQEAGALEDRLKSLSQK